MLGSSSFKWAQTQLCRPSGYGAYWLFVPYSRVLRYRPVKPSSDQLRGVHIAQPLLMKSRVLLRSGTRHTRFLSTTWIGKALDSFHKKKEYIWPFLHPLPPLVSGMAGHIWLLAFTPKNSTCISYNFFFFCPICLKFLHKFLYTYSFILSIKKNNWKISRFWVADPLKWVFKRNVTKSKFT